MQKHQLSDCQSGERTSFSFCCRMRRSFLVSGTCPSSSPASSPSSSETLVDCQTSKFLGNCWNDLLESAVKSRQSRTIQFLGGYRDKQRRADPSPQTLDAMNGRTGTGCDKSCTYIDLNFDPFHTYALSSISAVHPMHK